jgi:hypothetical protein
MTLTPAEIEELEKVAEAASKPYEPKWQADCSLEHEGMLPHGEYPSADVLDDHGERIMSELGFDIARHVAGFDPATALRLLADLKRARELVRDLNTLLHSAAPRGWVEWEDQTDAVGRARAFLQGDQT